MRDINHLPPFSMQIVYDYRETYKRKGVSRGCSVEGFGEGLAVSRAAGLGGGCGVFREVDSGGKRDLLPRSTSINEETSLDEK